MFDDILHQIIDLCYTIDKTAHTIYRELSRVYSEENTELTGFWEKMATEENEHMEFWKSMLLLVDHNVIPQLFCNPHAVKKELETIRDSSQNLMEKVADFPHKNKGFLIAYRLEFYLLHPAFEVLFNYAKNLESFVYISIPCEYYDDHIENFVAGFNRFGSISPEMILLGEMLKNIRRGSKRMAKQDNSDLITGILNRRGILQAVEPFLHFAKRKKNNIAVMLIDIDDFKKFNEKYGYEKGDAVLKLVADIMKSSIRRSDLCGRYSGEKFIVFLSEVQIGCAYRVAENIRLAVQQKQPVTPISISIGVYEATLEDIREISQNQIALLINKAEYHLEEAKAKGKNTVVGNKYC
ncbi:MAG: GGDEF domain-containing protein [bacterium]|nr:GGDEF domain-containing protein [bacterium]